AVGDLKLFDVETVEIADVDRRHAKAPRGICLYITAGGEAVNRRGRRQACRPCLRGTTPPSVPRPSDVKSVCLPKSRRRGSMASQCVLFGGSQLLLLLVIQLAGTDILYRAAWIVALPVLYAGLLPRLGGVIVAAAEAQELDDDDRRRVGRLSRWRRRGPYGRVRRRCQQGNRRR